MPRLSDHWRCPWGTRSLFSSFGIYNRGITFSFIWSGEFFSTKIVQMLLQVWCRCSSWGTSMKDKGMRYFLLFLLLLLLSLLLLLLLQLCILKSYNCLEQSVSCCSWFCWRQLSHAKFIPLKDLVIYFVFTQVRNLQALSLSQFVSDESGSHVVGFTKMVLPHLVKLFWV